MSDDCVDQGIDYRERYAALVSALGIQCDAGSADGVDHDHAVSKASFLRRATEGVPEACGDLLRSIMDVAATAGTKAMLREMVTSAGQRAARADDQPRIDPVNPLAHLFGNRAGNDVNGHIPGLDAVFEIMASADASRHARGPATATDRLHEIADGPEAAAVLALVDAARRLPEGEWWLDDNRPWRLMLNLSAVAEDDDLDVWDGAASVIKLFDHDNHQRGTVGDGQPAHMRAILRVLAASSALGREDAAGQPSDRASGDKT